MDGKCAIKGMDTKVYGLIVDADAQCYILLTGTPIEPPGGSRKIATHIVQGSFQVNRWRCVPPETPVNTSAGWVMGGVSRV